MLFPVVGGRWLGRIGSVIEIMHFYCSFKIFDLPTYARYTYIYVPNAERKRGREKERELRGGKVRGCNKAREIPRNVAFTRRATRGRIMHAQLYSSMARDSWSIVLAFCLLIRGEVLQLLLWKKNSRGRNAVSGNE